MNILRRHPRSLFAWFLVAVLLPAAGPALAEELPITLDTAVRAAIERNLDLRVQTFNPALSETDIRRARAVYDPNLSLLLDYRDSNAAVDPTLSFFANRRIFDANLSTDFLLSSGATASAAFTNFWSQDDLGTPFSRYAQPQVSLSLSQPVLRGFGKEITEKDITIAGYAKASSLLQWRSVAISKVADTRDAYFALVKARENLTTRRSSLAVAKEIHAGNQARVKAGVLASVELLDSEFGVAQREQDLLVAEKNVKDASDSLSVLIQYGVGSELVPADSIPVEPMEVSEQEEMAIALRNRPDLQDAKVGLQTEEFRTKVARNEMLPAVSLTGSAGLGGLAPGYGDALDELKSGNSPFWSIGVTLAFPLGNDAAKADLAAGLLQERQADTRIRSLTESIRLDVRSALRALDTSMRQVGAAQKGVVLGEARLASFLKRGKVGLATTTDILQAESDLTSSRETLTAARAAYQGAQTLLWKATGELLERQGIRIEDPAIEHLAWKEIR
ncbi:MAG: TolC family protein [Candidatus Deferrimicrobiaceae bacterium]